MVEEYFQYFEKIVIKKMLAMYVHAIGYREIKENVLLFVNKWRKLRKMFWKVENTTHLV